VTTISFEVQNRGALITAANRIKRKGLRLSHFASEQTDHSYDVSATGLNFHRKDSQASDQEANQGSAGIISPSPIWPGGVPPLFRANRTILCCWKL